MAEEEEKLTDFVLRSRGAIEPDLRGSVPDAEEWFDGPPPGIRELIRIGYVLVGISIVMLTIIVAILVVLLQDPQLADLGGGICAYVTV